MVGGRWAARGRDPHPGHQVDDEIITSTWIPYCIATAHFGRELVLGIGRDDLGALVVHGDLLDGWVMSAGGGRWSESTSVSCVRSNRGGRPYSMATAASAVSSDSSSEAIGDWWLTLKIASSPLVGLGSMNQPGWLPIGDRSVLHGHGRLGHQLPSWKHLAMISGSRTPCASPPSLDCTRVDRGRAWDAAGSGTRTARQLARAARRRGDRTGEQRKARDAMPAARPLHHDTIAMAGLAAPGRRRGPRAQPGVGRDTNPDEHRGRPPRRASGR